MVSPIPDRAIGDGIAVDTQALDDFAAAMVTGVQGNIAPNGDRLASTFAMGVQFGARNPSADVQALIAKYYECLQAINEQLYAYEMYAKTLTDAAQQIRLNYKDADALARASLEDIYNLLAIANAEATQPGLGPRDARFE